MAAYALSNHFAGESLLSNFDFFTGNDRNNGFVNYLDRESAMAQGLVSLQNETYVRLGVDSTTVLEANDTGRPSVMLTSKDDFTRGLFIADFNHMPNSACGLWPSFWAVNSGGQRPAGGEFSIIEGANTATRNLFSAHTGDGCTLPQEGFIGTQGSRQCDAPGGSGCNYAAAGKDSTSYGDAFNAADGGVYAVEWTDGDLKMWHFPRTGVPADIQVGHPDPAKWGLPHALFGGSDCGPDTHFYNMSLVLNTNFCGNYAGSLWGESGTCSQLASTCEEYVANYPEAFTEAYWGIKYIDVYQQRSGKANIDSRPASIYKPSRPVAKPAGQQQPLVKTVTLELAPAPTTGPMGLKMIGKHALLGCFESPGLFESFKISMKSPAMTNSLCVSSCSKKGIRYAGIHQDTCYCANDLGDASATTMTACTIPCPGDNSQLCGGPGAARNGTGETDGVWTVYGNLAREPLPRNAPGKGRPDDDRTGSMTVTRVSYENICSKKNTASLCQYDYYATLTPSQGVSGSQTTSIPTVPMATVTQTCDACGPSNESTVTLTIPVAIAATISSYTYSAKPKATTSKEDEEDVVVYTTQTVVPMPVYPAQNQTTVVLGMAGKSAVGTGRSGFTLLVTIWLGVFGLVVFL